MRLSIIGFNETVLLERPRLCEYAIRMSLLTLWQEILEKLNYLKRFFLKFWR